MIFKAGWLLFSQMLISFILIAYLRFWTWAVYTTSRASSTTLILFSNQTQSKFVLQRIGSFIQIFFYFSSLDSLTTFDCSTRDMVHFWCQKNTVTSIMQSRSSGEQRQEVPLLLFIYSTLFLLGFILHQLDLKGTEAPVLDTQ